MQPAIAKPLGSGARLLYDWTNNWASSNRTTYATDEYRKDGKWTDEGGEEGGTVGEL